MKKIFAAVLAVLMMLTACTKPVEQESESSEENSQSESKSFVSDENDLPITSVEKEQKFWKQYSDEYSVLEDGWANDEYYFTILKHKESEKTKLLFYDVEKEKIIDFGNIEIGFSESDFTFRYHFFSKDDAFYIMINRSQFLKIVFESLELSYIDTDIWDYWGNKSLIHDIFVSPFGTVAELIDESTIYLYDILAKDDITVIDTSEIAKEGILLNQGIQWSFNGKYFEIFVNEAWLIYASDRIYDNCCYALFSSDGEFIRYAYGNWGSWDNDSVWLYHDYRESPISHDRWSVYSLLNPEEEAKEVYMSNFAENGFLPMYSVHHMREYREEDNKTRILKIDVLTGTAKVVAIFDGNYFVNTSPSPSGKYFAKYSFNYESEEFFYYFLPITY